MRRRALTMTVVAVCVAVLLLAIPLGVFGGYQIWKMAEADVAASAQQYGRTIDRRLQNHEPITEKTLNSWLGINDDDTFLQVKLPGKAELITAGSFGQTQPLQAHYATLKGAQVTVMRSAANLWRSEAIMIAVIGVGIFLSVAVGIFLAARMSRRISAPMIYLAAQAEQLGSGSVRAQVKPSGIEEIDLVQAELQRTGERLAGRLAAERQFAADASHQLRTPLTALSMRLEEIEMISTEEEVQEEARVCLEQIERLTGVVEDLLKTSRQAGGGTTQAVSLDRFFKQQNDEWEKSFEKAGRSLVFENEIAQPVLVTPGNLSQVVATVIENSLKYGAGTTKITTRMAANKKGVFIDIGDEGEGVPDEIAPDIFEQGVSGHGSTGLGLALAKKLIQSDGGRIELTQRRPAVFSVFVAAAPAALDPAKVLPTSALISVQRRKRRF